MPHLFDDDLASGSLAQAPQVCQRLPLLPPGAARAACWLVQSYARNLAKLAAELVDAFPERLRTDTMAKAGEPKGGIYSPEAALRIELELLDPNRNTERRERRLKDSLKDLAGGIPWNLVAEWHELNSTMQVHSRAVQDYQAACRAKALEWLPGILRSFCIEAACLWPGSLEYAESQRPAVVFSQWELNCPGFQDLAGALVEFQQRQREFVFRDFYLTNIGKQVCETLDACLAGRLGGVVIGQSGRGKSASAKAWCEAHRGGARFAALKGYGDPRAVATALAEAWGLDLRFCKVGGVMLGRARDCLCSSELMLVLDGADYLLPEQGKRGRPELLDWLCGVRDEGVPVCLLASPQFDNRLAEIERRTNWEKARFITRFAGRWKVLDQYTTERHLTALAERLLPTLTKWDWAGPIGQGSGRDVAGLMDFVNAVRARAASAKREPNDSDWLEAGRQDRMPTEKAIRETFARPQTGGAGTRPRGACPFPAAPLQAPCEADTLPSHRQGQDRGRTVRPAQHDLPASRRGLVGV